MHIVQTNGNTATTSPGRSLHRLPNRRAKVFPAPNCLRSTPHNVACHSGTVLRAPSLAIFTYNATASGMDVLRLILTKADEGLEIQASVGKSLALHFVSVRQTSRQTLFQFTLFGASRQTLFQFGAQRRAGHRDGLRQRNSFTSVHLTGLS